MKILQALLIAVALVILIPIAILFLLFGFHFIAVAVGLLISIVVSCVVHALPLLFIVGVVYVFVKIFQTRRDHGCREDVDYFH